MISCTVSLICFHIILGGKNNKLHFVLDTVTKIYFPNSVLKADATAFIGGKKLFNIV
jgi:hypothetical protein